MIPSATTLPLPATAPEHPNLLSSADGNSSADANTPSFASHLDQFVTTAPPQTTGLSAQHQTAAPGQIQAVQTARNARSTAKSDANAQASDEVQDQAAPSPADNNASGSNDANQAAGKSVILNVSSEDRDVNKDINNEDAKAGQDTQTAAVTSISIAPLPLTTVNLAIANGVAPLPVPVQQMPVPVQQTPVPVQQTPSSVQQTPSSVQQTPSSVQQMPIPVQQTPVPVLQTNNTDSLPNAATTSTSTWVPGTSLPADPLNIPGVPMDSRSAVQTAVPGVVNALPQNSAASLPVSLSPQTVQTPPTTSIPSINAVISLAEPVAAPKAVVNAPFAVVTAPKAVVTAPLAVVSAPLPVVNAPFAVVTAPNTNASITNVPATTLDLSLPQPTAPTALPTSVKPVQQATVQQPIAQQTTAQQTTVQQMTVQPTTVQQTTVQQTTAKQTSTPKAMLPLLPIGSTSQEATSGVTVQSSAEKAIGETGENSAEVSTPGITTTEQNLGGIERLFTLGANKFTATGPAQSTEIGTGKSDTPPATPASAATLPAQNVSNKQQTPVALASQIHQAANDATAVSLPLSALPSLASGQIPAVLTPLAAATLTASIAGKTGALSQSIDALRDSNGTTALSATDIAKGADNGTGGIQIASFGAQGKTNSETSADSESQADSHREEAASSAAENKTDSTTQATSANPFSSLKAPGETPAANAITAPAGSSQIARAQIVEQVTRHLESMRISNGEGEMRMRLTPAHLGNVQISVATHPNGVVARIAVESAQIQQAMEGAKEHLRAGLEARGLHVNSVEVTVTPNLIGSGGTAFAGERGWQPTGDRTEGRSGYSRPNNTGQAVDDSPDAVPTAIPVAHVSLSRLDYRA